MRIRFLLPLLCLICTATISYAQHEATPRREIRHKLKHYPQEGDSQQTTTRASGEYIMQKFPTEGNIKGVVILAAFDDVPFSNDTVSTLLRNRYNADNYTEKIEFREYSEVFEDSTRMRVTLPGSARDYFRSMSFGKFEPSFNVIGPVTLDHPRAYYGANNSNGRDKNTSGMIRDACQKAYDLGLTDFSDYDNDGDGVVDVVYVVYAGSDEAQTGIEECIWAKASSITQTLGEMKISRYACSSELVIDLPVVAGIGTFVHEFSHILGLPDFYNTKADDFTMDVWSVMDYGMYNAEGFVPCAYTAFERYSLGWIPMQTLNEPATMNIGTTEKERQGYRIFTANLDSGTTITEADTASFYLVETICQEGWNRYAAAEGLLISEVTYQKSAWTNNTLNAGTQHRHCIVPANNDYNYMTANKHLFGNANHEFTLTSTPASRTQFGAEMDKPLTDTHYDKDTGKTFFQFRGGEDDTAIKHTTGAKVQHPELIFDLQGRRVQHPTKGVYIVNGKKVVIK